MSVCCECCVLSSRGLCDDLSLVQRSPTEYDASLYVIYKPRECGGPGPLGAVGPKERKKVSEL
jgi:hypothetical protein